MPKAKNSRLYLLSNRATVFRTGQECERSQPDQICKQRNTKEMFEAYAYLFRRIWGLSRSCFYEQTSSQSPVFRRALSSGVMTLRHLPSCDARDDRTGVCNYDIELIAVIRDYEEGVNGQAQ